MTTDGKIRLAWVHAKGTNAMGSSTSPARNRGPDHRLAWIGLIVVSGLFIASTAAARPPHVILVSLDGTRPMDVTAAELGAVAALRDSGAVAESMIGVSPSNTFPSHVSLITGVAPERHGIVNNRFVDPERGTFSTKVASIPSWIEVEPLWSWLADRGVPSASYYWVGSEGPWPLTGRGPLHWKPFSSKTREDAKVEQMLAWFDLEGDEHPRFISSWFHGADHAGHHDGPGTDAVHANLQEQNRAIEALISGLEARGAFEYTTLIFVSDHGMVAAERSVKLGSLFKANGVTARVLGIGGFANVNVRAGEGHADSVLRAVAIARDAGLEAYVRAEAPADWRVDNVRFGDVVVRAPVGTAITYGRLALEGYHGYAPEEPSMRAIFFARGRGAKPGESLGVVHAVDVAPTVAHLLGFEPPEWMEGHVIDGLRMDPVPSAPGSARLRRPPGSEMPHEASGEAR